MSDKNMLSLRKRLEELSTAKPDAMMQAELRKEVPDKNSVKLILGSLSSITLHNSTSLASAIFFSWHKVLMRIQIAFSIVILSPHGFMI